MANTILLKRSGVAAKVPVTANLSLGELSLNYTDGRLYTTNGTAIVDLSQNDKITLSGDATGTSTNPSAGSNWSNLAVTLSSTGVTAGNYGSATSIPTIVVDAKGRVTSITSNAVSTTISLGAGSGSGSVAGGGTLTVSGGTGITTSVTGSTYTITNGGVTGLSSSGAGNVTVSASTGAVTLALPATGPGAVSAGSSTAIPVVTTDAYGRVVGLTTAAVVAPAGTLSGSTLASGVTASSLTSVGTLVNLTVTNAISGSVTGSAGTAGTVTTAAQPNITTLAGLTSLGTAGVSTTAAGNFVVAGNLTVSGTYEYVNSIVTTHQDPILELNTGVNGAPLTGTAFDSGIKTHYWTGLADASAFFGRTNDTGSLEYYGYVSSESGNVITGTYGTIKSGALVLANSTASSSTTTGALQVSGGAGIAGAVYAGSLYDTGNRVLTSASSHSNSGGDVTVSGAYNALSLTLATVNTNVGTFGSGTTNQVITVNGKGLITAVTTATITPAWTSITSTPTTLSGYGITDALSTSATIDGGSF